MSPEMQRTYDVRVKEFVPLLPPQALKEEIPISWTAGDTVIAGRKAIERILHKEDPRLLVITGPCSIHNEEEALEYAERLNALREAVSETLCIVMRVYFEKPRTNVGWKGMINDPYMDGSCDIVEGLRRARRLLLKITEMGMPTATEMLDPISPQYIAGLVCWSAIGARTTESQTHREMASGLSMPVGFKNCTDGGLTTAVNAMIAAGSPQSFLGIDADGRSAVVKTTGNQYAHIVLRGGRRPNYDSVSIREAVDQLRAKNLLEAIIVDCSHANSSKKYQNQARVWQDCINQRLDGNDAIVGLMLESNLREGNQKLTDDPCRLAYGVSITDACISWETTEALIRSAHEQLLRSRRGNSGDAALSGNGRYKVAVTA
ncbi:3-deoxy-7-phosphoheptulonate synthase [Desulfococcus multivorans]|jgi:3-deoxy-7-phosphoheptulonate synthase|uniref:Phospho-2-dehydro-3-deoxyheptonate aldolase n=1 Tax=Desulfococcus multivorans DSM 2059 TaxID=1121405 RepID=S7UKH8_DESML|nr:3-deoxy-7-phosphoheptulonate synthase [Desulfococcus multivorans]AQV01033.1 3-deoxy-7-phosphoheptulonate synthase [Desulfococcus multivorans]EPR34339.1 phospho-2-dehydro-3-deoxyheptonate aldolase [Desulfococcus multivorans DSM 2059]MDX9819936.1 3-deoxy-7-phosphoheptulonate synthase [Desulfococcus multivorans]SJZ49365.1 3-deoxy-D-arabinoheptulosonate-7-phosphate synthase [Desulfococcus multivorans DSM 2059]